MSEANPANDPVKVTPDRYRAHNWIDAKTCKPIYGIEARVNKRWVHLAIDGQPAFYPTVAERNAKMKEMEVTPVSGILKEWSSGKGAQP